MWTCRLKGNVIAVSFGIAAPTITATILGRLANVARLCSGAFIYNITCNPQHPTEAAIIFSFER